MTDRGKGCVRSWSLGNRRITICGRPVFVILSNHLDPMRGGGTLWRLIRSHAAGWPALAVRTACHSRPRRASNIHPVYSNASSFESLPLGI